LKNNSKNSSSMPRDVSLFKNNFKNSRKNILTFLWLWPEIICDDIIY
jgi:hypothetical protein